MTGMAHPRDPRRSDADRTVALPTLGSGRGPDGVSGAGPAAGDPDGTPTRTGGIDGASGGAAATPDGGAASAPGGGPSGGAAAPVGDPAEVTQALPQAGGPQDTTRELWPVRSAVLGAGLADDAAQTAVHGAGLPAEPVDTMVLRPEPGAAMVASYEPGTYGKPTHPGGTTTGTAPGDGGAPAGPEEGAGSVARNSAVMAVGSLVSRLTGFLRTAAIGAAIGAAFVADDYNLANTLPNMVYELLLGGVLASVVVPLLVRARTQDADRGEAYTHRLLTLTTVFLGVATLVAVLAAPLLTTLLANGRTSGADRALTTSLAYLLLPEIFFYGLAAVLAAVLNARHHFAAPMWTPILNNVVVIATAVLFIAWRGSGTPTPQTITAGQVLLLGVGTTLGIVVQALGLWPALRRVGFRWRWRFDWRALHLSELARIGAWALCYVVVSQIGVFAVLKIAKYAADRGGPGPAIYLNSFVVFMMVHGIVAVSIITALMPRLSAAAAERRYDEVARGLSLGTRLSAVLLVPATAAYVVLGRPLAVVLFGYGAYQHSKALATGDVIAWSALGLVPFAISQLQMFTFYALPDTRTPALINIPAVALRIAVDVLVMLALGAGVVVSGLMFGNAISFVLACVIGYWLLRRRLGPLGMREVAVSLARLGAAALAAAIPALLLVLALVRWLGTGTVASLVQLVAGGLVLGGLFVVFAILLRAREITEVAGMVRGRLGR